jgi:peptidoglycan/LPS O-acetylase OafA/YrhL
VTEERPSPTPRLPAFGTSIPVLDGVRGLAILVVMLFHYEVRSLPPFGGGVRTIVGWGVGLSWTGLELFFVLSGFLITGILWETRDKPSYLRNFYKRRVLRILPLYYGFLFVLFVVLPFVGVEAETPLSRQAWYWAHASNFLFVLKGWGVSHRFTPHFWSLAVEEQYYLVWPLVVFLLSRRVLMRVCAAAVVASLALRVVMLWVGASYPTVFMLTPAHLDALAMGSFMALAVRGPGGLAALLRRVRLPALSAAGLLVLLFAWRAHPTYRDGVTLTIGYTLVAVLFGCLMVAVVAAQRTSVAGTILNNRWLRLLGVRSYGLYVFHFPVMVWLQSHGLGLRDLLSALHSEALGHLAWVGLNAGLTLAIALASWHLYERHFMTMKGWFAYGRARRAPAPAPDEGLSPAALGS